MSKSSITSNVIWKFTEKTTAQLLTFAVSIVLARMLEPNDFGLISMITVFISLANALVDSGFSNALVQKKNTDSLDYSTIFYLCVIISTIMYSILFFTAPFISEFYEISELEKVIRVLGLTVIISPLYIIQHAYVTKNMIFKRFFWSSFGGCTISTALGIIMAINGFGVWALVAQQLANRTTDTIILWFTVRWRPKLAFSFKRAKELFSYGWKLLIDGILNTLITNMRELIIGKVYAPSDLAFYNKASEFPKALMSNINTSVQTVTFPAVSNVQNDIVLLKEITRKTIRISSFIVFPMLFGISLVSESLVILLLGEKWLPSVPFIWIFCFGYGVSIMQIGIQNAVMAIGRSDVHLIMNLITKAAAIILLLIVMHISVMAIALIGFIAGTLNVIVKMIVGKKYIGYTYKENFTDNTPILIGCAIMSAPVYLISIVGFSNLITIFLQVSTGAVVYILYSFIFKLDGLKFVLNLIKQLFKKKDKNA